MPKISIPPPYRGPTRGEATVSVSGETVRACIEDAEARYPGIREQVLDSHGELHRFVRLFRNGALLQGATLDAMVEDEDEIAVVAAIAGG
jgi:adenylyltransferase/sulfurtransferase